MEKPEQSPNIDDVWKGTKPNHIYRGGRPNGKDIPLVSPPSASATEEVLEQPDKATSGNKIYCMNWKELVKNFKDKEIDLLVIDPPYGINIGKMSYTNDLKGGVAKRTDYRNHNKKWDEETLKEEDIKELLRVSKNQIIFGANHFANLLPNTKGWVVWDKRTADKYNNDFADCELIWTSFQKPARIIRWLWSGMLQGDMKNKEKRVHPTQKPVYVMKRLLELYSNENDLILDCFCGSGSTLLACKQLNRRFIGCDIQQEYVNIANKRLEEDKNSESGE